MQTLVHIREAASRARTLHAGSCGGIDTMDTQRSPERLDDVRLAIFRQHTQLAQLLDELETNADAVLTNGADGQALRSTIDALHARFARHLEYEESHLASELSGDHAEQRRRMKGLVHDREVFGDPRGLAREARAFAHVLRKDIAEEDAKLRALA
jgi:hypothetical protein